MSSVHQVALLGKEKSVFFQIVGSFIFNSLLVFFFCFSLPSFSQILSYNFVRAFKISSMSSDLPLYEHFSYNASKE